MLRGSPGFSSRFSLRAGFSPLRAAECPYARGALRAKLRGRPEFFVLPLSPVRGGGNFIFALGPGGERRTARNGTEPGGNRMTRACLKVACWGSFVLLGSAGPVMAQPPSKDTAPTTAEPEVLKIHLMDGSQIGGKLTTSQLEVETAYGKLTIPVAAIVSLTPGLGSHPQVGQNLDELIEKLGSPAFAEPRGAQSCPRGGMGPSIRVKLARAAEDADTDAAAAARQGRFSKSSIRPKRMSTNEEQSPAPRLIGWRYDRDGGLHRGRQNRAAGIRDCQSVRRAESEAQRHPPHRARNDGQTRLCKRP